MIKIVYSSFNGNLTRLICNACDSIIREWLDINLGVGQSGYSVTLCEKCRRAVK